MLPGIILPQASLIGAVNAGRDQAKLANSVTAKAMTSTVILDLEPQVLCGTQVQVRPSSSGT